MNEMNGRLAARRNVQDATFFAGETTPRPQSNRSRSFDLIQIEEHLKEFRVQFYDEKVRRKNQVEVDGVSLNNSVSVIWDLGL